MQGLGKHAEEGLEGEGAGAEEVDPGFDDGPVHKVDMVVWRVGSAGVA